MEPTEPNIRMIERQARPQECILTILKTFNTMVNTNKGIQQVMVQNTEEENIKLWIAYWWLKKNKQAMIDIPIDMPREERAEMCELTLDAFRIAENKIKALGEIVSMCSVFMGRDEMENILREKLDNKLTLEKLNEILSIIHMRIEDADARSN